MTDPSRSRWCIVLPNDGVHGEMYGGTIARFLNGTNRIDTFHEIRATLTATVQSKVYAPYFYRWKYTCFCHTYPGEIPFLCFRRVRQIFGEQRAHVSTSGAFQQPFSSEESVSGLVYPVGISLV